MLRFTTMTAAVLLAGLTAGSSMADETCLKAATGVQCDTFLEDYRDRETPVGTTDFQSTGPYLLEHFGDTGFQAASGSAQGKNLLYWDGDSAMIVPEESGARVEIADW